MQILPIEQLDLLSGTSVVETCAAHRMRIGCSARSPLPNRFDLSHTFQSFQIQGISSPANDCRIEPAGGPDHLSAHAPDLTRKIRRDRNVFGIDGNSAQESLFQGLFSNGQTPFHNGLLSVWLVLEIDPIFCSLGRGQEGHQVGKE
ncbi:MAG: Uncharacterised protein [Flavobacteriia bacterium]|nr:MAG: Uncharacterised protein [Flavobacteriia bacterium]